MLTLGSLQSTEKEAWISLYFHLPFCKKKCPYCHFYVVPSQESLHANYIDSLLKEWRRIVPLLAKRTIYSLYFGGGTPSQLSPSLINHLLNTILETPLEFHPDLEITFEANPEDLSQNYLKELKTTAINRLSMGVQSLHDPSLHLLGRNHNASKATEAILTAAHVGFENISIDLMYDLPYQTLSSWQETLHALKNLPISHLSLYNLTIEPHTPFYQQKEKLLPTIPKDKESLQLLNHAIDTLETIGLHRYEISAFAKLGMHSKHNTGYWLGREFFGLGPSAFSYFNSKRFRNVANLKKYVDCLNQEKPTVDFEEELEKEAALRENLIVRLRLQEGADLSTFPSLPPSILQDISSLKKEGLLHQEGSRLYLTSQGTLFYDTVAETLV